MATLLDAALLSHFSTLFVFLFVLIASYGVLISIKIIENNALNGIISLVLAALFASSSTATSVFEYATPWFVLLFILIFFIVFMLKFTGAEEIVDLKKNTTVIIIIIIIILTIFVLSAGQVNKEKKEALLEAGEIEEETAILSFPGKVGETMRNPAVFGLLVVLLIATFAALLLSTAPKK